MIKILSEHTSITHFSAYVVLLYLVAMTAGSWVPPSSPIYESASYIKLALIPVAQAFLMSGTRTRWPGSMWTVAAASSAFYAGIVVSTVWASFT